MKSLGKVLSVEVWLRDIINMTIPDGKVFQSPIKEGDVIRGTATAELMKLMTAKCNIKYRNKFEKDPNVNAINLLDIMFLDVAIKKGMSEVVPNVRYDHLFLRDDGAIVTRATKRASCR